MSAPAIYSPRPVAQKMSVGGRLLAAAVALGCAAMLVVGASLPPDPSGVGTHLHLHLQPCQFLYRTGIPCPSCGYTTSVSFFAHGNLLASLWVQPMGFVIALAAAMTFWAGLYIALSGRSASRLLRMIPPRYYLLAPMFFAIAAWGWKIWIHWYGIDGW